MRLSFTDEKMRMRYFPVPYAAARNAIDAEPGVVCAIKILGHLSSHLVSHMNLPDWRTPWETLRLVAT